MTTSRNFSNIKGRFQHVGYAEQGRKWIKTTMAVVLHDKKHWFESVEINEISIPVFFWFIRKTDRLPSISYHQIVDHAVWRYPRLNFSALLSICIRMISLS